MGTLALDQTVGVDQMKQAEEAIYRYTNGDESSAEEPHWIHWMNSSINKPITWTVGLRGVRVGEASNPGPKGMQKTAPGTVYYGKIGGQYRLGMLKSRQGEKGAYSWNIVVHASPTDTDTYPLPAQDGGDSLLCRDISVRSMGGLTRAPVDTIAYKAWAPAGYARNSTRWLPALPELAASTVQAGVKRLRLDDPAERASKAPRSGPGPASHSNEIRYLDWWDEIDNGEAFVDRTFTSDDLPPALTVAIADAHVRILEAVAEAPRGSANEARLWKLLTFIDRLLFCLRPGGRKVRRGGRKAGKAKGHGWERTLAFRLRLVASGDWATLWREASKAELSPPASAAPATVRTARRVDAYARAGEWSRAVTAVCSTTTVCSEHSDHAALLPLFPRQHGEEEGENKQSVTLGMADASESVNSQYVEVPAQTREKIQVAVGWALAHGRRKSGTGPNDARYEHWFPLASTDRGLTAAGVVLTRLLLSEAPAEAVHANLSATVHARAKPDGGRRPIACGGVMRRLAAKAVCHAFKDELADACGPQQFAVGRSGGVEKVHKTLEVLAELRPTAAFLKLDFRNAFNSVKRSAVLRAVQKRKPELSRVATTLLPKTTHHWWYDKQGGAKQIEAECGVDQGCPLSPALFAMAMADPLATLTAQLREVDPQVQVLSYLDDVYVVTTTENATEALSAAAKCFAPLGLELNRSKTEAWSPKPDADLPEGVRRPATLVCLGSTLRWDADDELSYMEVDGEHSDDHSSQWNQSLHRLRHFTAQLDVLRQNGLPLHVALVLHRTFVNGAISHLLRAGGCPDWFAALWDGEVKAWYSRELQRDLPDSARTLLTLPFKLGGCGVSSVTHVRDAALVGSWDLCLKDVATKLGANSAAQFRDGAPITSKRIDEAADRLRQAGVPDFHFEWEAAIVEAKAGQQHEHTQAIHEARHSGLLDSLPAEAAADVRSGGGPGAGSFMDLPDESAIRLDDYRLRTCLRARLLLPHPAHDPTRASAPTTHCQHRNASSGVTCGRPLDASGQHAETCGEGGATVRGHNAVRDALAAFLVASGSPAEIEQHVPAWDRPERDLRGNTKVDSAGHTVYDRAILDVSFYERGTGRRAHADVVIGSAKTVDAADRQLRAQMDGRKAGQSAARKRARYPPTANPGEGLVPFAIEARGRLGEDALALLRSMAPGDPRVRAKVLSQGMRFISACVQIRLAELLISAETASAPK